VVGLDLFRVLFACDGGRLEDDVFEE
jgi:hypothetical protein